MLGGMITFRESGRFVLREVVDEVDSDARQPNGAVD